MSARAVVIVIASLLLAVLALRGHGSSWLDDPTPSPSSTVLLPRCQDGGVVCTWGRP